MHLSDRHFDMTGLAVDWVSQNIYLADAAGKAVYRYNYEGQRGKVVVHLTPSDVNTNILKEIQSHLSFSLLLLHQGHAGRHVLSLL